MRLKSVVKSKIEIILVAISILLKPASLSEEIKTPSCSLHYLSAHDKQHNVIKLSWEKKY